MSGVAMPRRLRDFAYDAVCVLLFVVIGTRNHRTDTGLSGILFVAAPFLIGLTLTHVTPLLQSGAKALPHPYVVWGYTVVMGLVMRNVVFDRGTAPAFVIVTTIFLGITMLGWREAVQRFGKAK